MSLVHLANTCSHLQNASRARLGLTSIPDTKFHLGLMLALQNSGFISSVVRGGAEPPPSHKLLTHPTSSDPAHPIEPVTRHNISSRRLWLGLKYWNSEPVLSKMSLVSKPTRRIWMDTPGLTKLVLGKNSGYVKGLTTTGECLYEIECLRVSGFQFQFHGDTSRQERLLLNCSPEGPHVRAGLGPTATIQHEKNGQG
ncbi:hypothetical protein H2202_000883 [Exophiala xenobiotica]|nr:hypothetical protein H2202_000883 [Exophiala xenobiotica]KAK5262455.1 hypothetical protein LTR40_000295 [Exophiala xenobiotica]